MHIAVCGLGKMGAAMAARLLDLHGALTVWNRDGAKADALVLAGATRAQTPAAAVSASDVIITMLLNADAIAAVYEAPGGLLSAPLAGKLVIDMSTVLPTTQEAIGAAVIANGGGFVACPVGGTIGPARSGKLLGFAGGNAEDLARARPILDQLCRKVEDVGPIGAAAKLKLAVNLPLLVGWQALGEALALAKPLGLPPTRLIDILADTSGATAAFKMRSADIAAALGGAPPAAAAFDVNAARKDLGAMMDLAESLGIRLPAAKAALEGFDTAIAHGLGHADATAVATAWGAAKA